MNGSADDGSLYGSAAIKQEVLVVKRILPFVVLGIVICAVIWQQDALKSLFNPDQQQNNRAGGRGSVPVKVITQPVEMTDNDRVFAAVGTGKARLSVALYPSVSDEVKEVLFEAQQAVKQGDVLVQLDDREEQLAAKLAEVRLKDAKSLLDRYEQAVKEGAVPESEVDSARADYEGAEVALDQAKLALEERQIIAPFDGVVGIPSVDPGDRVSPDTLITGLDDRAVLHIDFEVPEALAGALKNAQAEKQKITATTPAYPDEEFEGYISAQESRIDPARRTLMARASIVNKDDMLRPGMSFDTVWAIKGKPYATVPEISVQWGRDGSYVWLIRDGKAQQVKAKVVARKGGLVLMEGEINEGDAVVIEGLQRLRAGQVVEVLGESES